MKGDAGPIRGRGAAGNPPIRFERLRYEPDEGESLADEGGPTPATEFYRDSTRSIIASNTSPDVGFEVSINPYRGCEHGCIYCYARPTHEYLGLSAGLDFESKIMVKEDAPQLLRRELGSRRWRPQPLAISGVTDAYQPIERRLRLTRRCLEVLAEFRNPVIIITKSHLVTRDIDLLAELARHDAAAVAVTLTSLDGNLTRVLEPRAARPAARLDAIEELNRAGVPAGTMVAPVIPGLTDHEIPAILAAAAGRGARFAGHTPVRLPLAVAPLFDRWLEQHFPDRKEKVLGRIRSLRQGRLNDPQFGSRMRGDGPMAEAIHRLFRIARRKAGIPEEWVKLSATAFRNPAGGQRCLFD